MDSNSIHDASENRPEEERNERRRLSVGLSVCPVDVGCARRWPTLWILGPMVVETYTAENVLVMQETELSLDWDFVAKELVA